MRDLIWGQVAEEKKFGRDGSSRQGTTDDCSPCTLSWWVWIEGGTWGAKKNQNRAYIIPYDCIPTLLDGLNSNLAAEDVENILGLALVLGMTETLHGLLQLCLYIRADFREVGLDGGILRLDMRTVEAVRENTWVGSPSCQSPAHSAATTTSRLMRLRLDRRWRRE